MLRASSSLSKHPMFPVTNFRAERQRKDEMLIWRKDGMLIAFHGLGPLALRVEYFRRCRACIPVSR